MKTLVHVVITIPTETRKGEVRRGRLRDARREMRESLVELRQRRSPPLRGPMVPSMIDPTTVTVYISSPILGTCTTARVCSRIATAPPARDPVFADLRVANRVGQRTQ